MVIDKRINLNSALILKTKQEGKFIGAYFPQKEETFLQSCRNVAVAHRDGLIDGSEMSKQLFMLRVRKNSYLAENPPWNNTEAKKLYKRLSNSLEL